MRQAAAFRPLSFCRSSLPMRPQPMTSTLISCSALSEASISRDTAPSAVTAALPAVNSGRCIQSNTLCPCHCAVSLNFELSLPPRISGVSLSSSSSFSAERGSAAKGAFSMP